MTITSQQIDAWDAEVGAAYASGVAAGAAAERESCARFVEEGYVRQFENPWREDLAAAIRARENT